MADGLVLLVGGLLLLAAPAFQWQVAQANPGLCARRALFRVVALSALVLGVVAGLGSVATGVALLA